MRKKVDERIRTLIENGVKLRHRSMFVIVGDKSRDQVISSVLLIKNLYFFILLQFFFFFFWVLGDEL